MYNDLNGKVAVVTGSSSGIGKAIVYRFVKEGMKVVINYYHDEEAANEMVKDIAKYNGLAVAVKGDVKNEKDIHLLLKAANDSFGHMDIWVNNAGIQKSSPSHSLSLKEWQEVIDTNLTGVFLGAREAINHFLEKQKRGNIINISSIHEVMPWSNYVHYAASKAGVKMITQTLAKEYAQNGIRVNSIGPGAINTPINTENFSNPNKNPDDDKKIPLGYVGSPEEIAKVAVWLASEEASYVTGTTIYADGGLLLYP